MFALVEFHEENGAMEIVETKTINSFELANAKRHMEVLVKWANRFKQQKIEKLYSAKLLQIADNRGDLTSTLNKIVEANTLRVLDDEPFIISQKRCDKLHLKRPIKLPKKLSDNDSKNENGNCKASISLKKKAACQAQKKAAVIRSQEIIDISAKSNQYDKDCEYTSFTKSLSAASYASSKLSPDLKKKRIINFMESDESSLENDAFTKHASKDLLKAELAYEREKRINAEKELQNYKECYELTKELRIALSAAKQLSQKHICTNPPVFSEIAVKDTSSLLQPLQRQDNFKHEMKSPLILDQPIPYSDLCYESPQLQSITDQENGNMVLAGTDICLPQNVYTGISQKNFSRYSADLLLAVFGRQMLQTHALKKLGSSSKPALDQKKLTQIIDHIVAKFNVEKSVVRAALRNKMSNVKDKKGKQLDKSEDPET